MKLDLNMMIFRNYFVPGTIEKRKGKSRGSEKLYIDDVKTSDDHLEGSGTSAEGYNKQKWDYDLAHV